ncbi:hypothetical protein HZC09_05150 [Candidatus Micrarchaeota archaeon]|nr:hypothetical protein [Candidatus Micrarchaeota archaeon]
MMLLTTSRKPCQNTRAIARALAKLLGVHYANRGKSSFDKVAEWAERKALKEILFVWDAHGNPSKIVVYDLEEGAWVELELHIKGANFPRIPFRRQGCKIKAEDAFGRKAAKLFSHSSGPNTILLSSDGLKGFSEDKLVLELKFLKGVFR